MNKTIGLLLAGGVGSRLGVLASSRAKPAVPFGGIYRIIDFTLSNAANSGITRLGVLTQYKPLSLMEHIGDGAAWGFLGRTRGLKILPPHTGEKDSDWYRGTADAVRQNMNYVMNNDYCDTLIVLSGDHIYHMDYSDVVAFHRARSADLTIAMMEVPIEDACHFGVASIDGEQRVIDWQEKPPEPKCNLVSMGVYIFDKYFLNRLFAEIPGDDFGKDIIPYAYRNAATFAYKFNGYWRDVGTVKAFWEANLDLIDPSCAIDLENWQIYTNPDEVSRVGDRPPTYLGRKANVYHSMISQGCIIEGEVVNSVLSPGVWIQKGAVVKNSVIMHGCEIGGHATVENAIFDKHVTVGDYARIGRRLDVPLNGYPAGQPQYGITVVGKYASIPPRCRIGTNCVIYPRVKERDFPDLLIEHGTRLVKPSLEDA